MNIEYRKTDIGRDAYLPDGTVIPIVDPLVPTIRYQYCYYEYDESAEDVPVTGEFINLDTITIPNGIFISLPTSSTATFFFI
jgi:hypothetical protein